MNLFFETSAKTGFNSKNLFIEAAKILYFEYLNYHEKKKSIINEVNDNNDIIKVKFNVKNNIPHAKKLKREILEDDERINKGCC